jgi:hypothetical protein
MTLMGGVMSGLYLYLLLYPFSSGNLEQPGAKALRRFKAEYELQIDPRLSSCLWKGLFPG